MNQDTLLPDEANRVRSVDSDQMWRDQETARRQKNLDQLASRFGERYFEVPREKRELYGTPEDQAKQKKVFAQIDSYIDNMATHFKTGRNLILCGSKGAGKDLALSQCMSHAILKGNVWIVWKNGTQFYVELKNAAMWRPGDDGGDLTYRIETYVNTKLLALSDPLPVTGSLTESQATSFLAIIDGRWRSRRPTWLTMNVASRKDAETRLGPMLVDRLFENAEIVFFDWPSYREHARKQIEATNDRD